MSREQEPEYSFRAMRVDDLPMVNAWLDTPDVRQWWLDAEGIFDGCLDEAYLDDPEVESFIVSHEGTPFALLQSYDPHSHPGHHFAFLPDGARGIDQVIGVPDMLGRGHGSAFIRRFTDAMLDAGVPAVGTDPHPGNARAIRAYEKADFERGEIVDTEWGPAMLMVKRRRSPAIF